MKGGLKATFLHDWGVDNCIERAVYVASRRRDGDDSDDAKCNALSTFIHPRSSFLLRLSLLNPHPFAFPFIIVSAPSLPVEFGLFVTCFDTRCCEMPGTNLSFAIRLQFV
jgi:hypothetical protein